MLESIHAKNRSHLEFWFRLLLFYVAHLLAIASITEPTSLDKSPVTVFRPISTVLPDDKILNSQDLAKFSTPQFEGKKDYANGHSVSRNRYFSRHSNSNLHYEVLSNHAPPEINVNTSRDKSSSPSHAENGDLPPWPTKENMKSSISYSSKMTQIVIKPTSAAMHKNGSEALDGTTKSRSDDVSAISARRSNDSESALILSTNRQSYIAPPSPFVVMNNHQPRPFILPKDKVYSWIANSDTSTNADSTTTSPYSSAESSLTTSKPVTQTKSTTETKRKGTTVTKRVTTPRPPKRKTYKPYEYTAYSGTTEMSIPLTTKRPTGHAVGIQSFRPLASFMTHAVVTIASFVQKSFLNSLLVLIPSTLLGLLLL